MVTRRKKHDQSAIQGEGDYRSAREFNDTERRFVRSHDTEKLAKEAAPDDASRAAELEQAQQKRKARARPDPEVDPEEQARDRESGIMDETPPRH